MNLLEIFWAFLAVILLATFVFIDPKSSLASANTNNVLSGFAKPSSKQNFIFSASNILIGLFFLLTLILSCIG
jgi:preprotein translocase subunit SecG|tara:strand:+ start:453 stop:671 length:219 start_codon:yes stop_codon:yes gene_type:complete